MVSALTHPTVVLFLVAAAFGCALGCTSKSSNQQGGVTTEGTNCVYSCGICGKPIDVFLVFSNQYKEPFFNFNVSVVNKPRRELIYFLERASESDTRARFKASHHGTLGYMIDAINRLEASVDDKTYWKFVEHKTNKALQLGASSYVPMHEEVIRLEFTTWGPH